jgi:hypothetical protein
VSVDELAAVDPERRLAVELTRTLFDVRQLREPREEIHASSE